MLEYQPKILLPGRGLIVYEPYFAQQCTLLSQSQFRHVNKSRQIGWTTTLAIEAVWAFAHTPAAEIVVLSKSQDEAIKFLNKFYVAYDSVFKRDPQMPALVKRNNLSAAGENGATITVLTSSKGAGRSFSATAVYFDEMAHTIYADDIYQAAIPSISVTGGRVTLFSTPKGKANKFYEIGSEPEDFGYEGFQFEWWWSPLHNRFYKDFITAYFAGDQEGQRVAIEKARNHKLFKILRRSFKGSELAFQQEYECRYDANTNSVFSSAQIKSFFKPRAEFPDLHHDEENDYTDECWTSDRQEGHIYETGVDLGRKRDATVIVTFDTSVAPIRLVEYKRLPPGTADWSIIHLAVRQTHDKFKTSEMVHDSTGVGDSISEIIEDISEPIQIKNNTARTGMKYNLIENLRRAADDRAVIMPKIKQLRKEFEGYEWDDKNLVQDSVMAVALIASQFYEAEAVWSGVDTTVSYTEGFS